MNSFSKPAFISVEDAGQKKMTEMKSWRSHPIIYHCDKGRLKRGIKNFDSRSGDVDEYGLKGCCDKPEFLFVVFEQFYHFVKKYLIIDKHIKNKKRPRHLKIPKGINRITLRDGTVLLGFARDIFPKSTFTLTLLGTSVKVEIFEHAVLMCEPIPSQLRARLDVKPGDILPLRLGDMVYDPFDDRISFEKWRTLLIDHLKTSQSLAGDHILTLLQLCRDEDIDAIEKEVNLQNYPDAAEFYFRAGQFERLHSWDDVERIIDALGIKGGFLGQQLTMPELLRLCQKIKEIGIVGSHPNMIRLYVDVVRAGNYIATFKSIHLPNVLITGEAGSGKELMSQAVHQLSGRTEAFNRVNCATFPNDLLESFLFGHAKGAFTGAISDKKGYVAASEKGTLLLDEIGQLPVNQRPKILRLLENREYQMVGETKSRQADILFLAATNADLQTMVEQGNFPADLYQRLKGIHLHVPSLRDRIEDIPLLVDHFLQQLKRNADHQLCPYRFPIALWCHQQAKKTNLSVRELRQRLEELAPHSLPLNTARAVKEDPKMAKQMRELQDAIDALKAKGYSPPFTRTLVAEQVKCRRMSLTFDKANLSPSGGWVSAVEEFVEQGLIKGSTKK